jgi:hypothetical protein
MVTERSASDERDDSQAKIAQTRYQADSALKWRFQTSGIDSSRTFSTETIIAGGQLLSVSVASYSYSLLPIGTAPLTRCIPSGCNVSGA